jgi:phage terminase large subunit-like protein
VYTTDANGIRWIIAKSGKRYWFDKQAADAACAFFPTYLRHTKGEWYGRPFVLTRRERRIVRKVFGWKRPDGTRRYRRIWIEWPRKNGKTEFAAGLALLLLIADGEFGAEIYSLASEENQARIVFDVAARMIGMSEELKAEVETFKTSLYCAALASSFKPLSALPNSKQGFNPHGFIGDEVHVWPNGELAEAVHEGEGARLQPLDILITTAGELDTYAHEQHEYAIAVEKGEIEDDELFVEIAAADPDADWTDPATWAAANPSYNVTVKPSFFEAECRKARNLPRLQNRFRRYYLNQWVEQATRWIPMEYWDCCTRAPSAAAKALLLGDDELEDGLKAKIERAGAHDAALWKKLPERLAKRPCCGGLDLATTRDLNSLCLVFPPTAEDELTSFLWRFYLPRETLKLLKIETRKRYEQWEADGALTITNGNVVDYTFIRKDVREFTGMFRFGSLGVDPYNATQTAIDLRDQDGMPVEFFRQGFLSMNAPAKAFEAKVLSLEIEHGNHPIARQHAKNVAVETDANENIKPVKPRAKSAKGKGKAAGGGTQSEAKVDGVVAAVTGLGMVMTKPVDTGPNLGELIEQGYAIG